MKKGVYYFCVLVMLGLFCLVMNGGNYLKSARSDKDNVELYLNRLEDNIKAESWEGAAQNCEKLNKAWKAVTPRIQFSVEKSELDGINVTLSRINAYVIMKDQAAAYAELKEAQEHWVNLNH